MSGTITACVSCSGTEGSSGHRHTTATKRISLIIPTFNCAEYIDETLMSVLPQLPDDCELIVVDDGSADETPDALRRYAEGYDGLRIAFNENGGVSSARNTGLDMAAGACVSA